MSVSSKAIVCCSLKRASRAKSDESVNRPITTLAASLNVSKVGASSRFARTAPTRTLLVKTSAWCVWLDSKQISMGKIIWKQDKKAKLSLKVSIINFEIRRGLL